MSTPVDTPSPAVTAAITRTVNDARSISGDASAQDLSANVRLNQDVQNIWQAAKQSGQGQAAFENDMRLLNDNLHQQGLLPNLQIMGLDGSNKLLIAAGNERQLLGIDPGKINFTTPAQDAATGTQPDYYLNAEGQLLKNPKATPGKDGSISIEVEGNNSAKQAKQYADQLQKQAISDLVAMYKAANPGAKIPEMWQAIIDAQPDPSYPNGGDDQNNTTVTPADEQAYDKGQPAPPDESTNTQPVEQPQPAPVVQPEATAPAEGYNGSGGTSSGGTSSGGVSRADTSGSGYSSGASSGGGSSASDGGGGTSGSGSDSAASPPSFNNGPTIGDVSDPNSFMITEMRSKFNPDGPLSGANCGPASLAMALDHFGKMPEGEDPEKFVEQTRLAMGAGTNQDSPTTVAQVARGAEAAGLNAQTISPDNGVSNEINGINTALGKGEMVVANGDPIGYENDGTVNATKGGDYNFGGKYDGGHFILIAGLQNGDYIVNDPLNGNGGSIKLTEQQLATYLSKDGGGCVAIGPK